MKRNQIVLASIQFPKMTIDEARELDREVYEVTLSTLPQWVEIDAFMDKSLFP